MGAHPGVSVSQVAPVPRCELIVIPTRRGDPDHRGLNAGVGMGMLDARSSSTSAISLPAMAVFGRARPWRAVAMADARVAAFALTGRGLLTQIR
jgi:hypothetical protein